MSRWRAPGPTDPPMPETAVSSELIGYSPFRPLLEDVLVAQLLGGMPAVHPLTDSGNPVDAMYADSVRRKRKHKINKHKHRYGDCVDVDVLVLVGAQERKQDLKSRQDSSFDYSGILCQLIASHDLPGVQEAH